MTDELDRSRFRRAMRLSALGAKLALHQGRGLVSRDNAAVHAAVAELLVRELGKLKGLPMKIGQILSYMEGAVPEEQRAIYQKALATLRVRAAPLAPEVCLRVLEQELGGPPERLFDRFDPAPIAVASIGQVYRARLGEQEVCVKVQYPGIAEATDSDLRNIDSILALMRTVMPSVDTEQLVADFRDRLHEECDYLREAEVQHRFASIYAGDDALVVPVVIGSHSTARVLTTVYIDGIGLDEFVAVATPEERNRAGMALFRMAFGTLLEHGLFHADPHPGNLLFRSGPASKLGVLDFGCVQPVDPSARRDLARLLRAAIDGGDMVLPARQALGIDEIDETTEKVVVGLTRQVLAPIVAPQPFRFTRAFATDIAKSVVDAKMKLATRFLTRKGRIRLKREGVMFVVRNLFGLASIWGALECEGDFRALTQTLVANAA